MGLSANLQEDLFIIVDTKELDELEFNLTLNELEIIHYRNCTKIGQSTIPLVAGLPVYYWVCSQGFRLGLWVYENLKQCISVDEKGILQTGEVVMENTSVGGLDITGSCMDVKKITFPSGQEEALKFSDGNSPYILFDSKNQSVELKQNAETTSIQSTTLNCTTLTANPILIDDIKINGNCIDLGSGNITFTNNLTIGNHIVLNPDISLLKNTNAQGAEFKNLNGTSLQSGDINLDGQCISFQSAGIISTPLEIKDTTTTYISADAGQLITGDVKATNIKSTIITAQSATIGTIGIDGDTINGDLTLNGVVTLNKDPISDLSIATKKYVDLLSQNLDPKESVRVVTATALPPYAQMGAGVGAYLMSVAPGDLNGTGIDSITDLKVGERLLVESKGSQNDTDNGIYEITQLGDGSNPWIFTRSEDADTGTKLSASSYVFVDEGSQGNTSWLLTTNDPIVIDTTPLRWIKFSQAGVIEGTNVGVGDDIFRDKTGTTLNFKSLLGSSRIIITDNPSELKIGFDQTQIIQTGALSGGSISVGFGSIDVPSITASPVLVDNITLSGTEIKSSTNINLSAVGDVLLPADPTLPLHAATKQYVDNFPILNAGSNLGTGTGVFAQVNVPDLEFKSISSGGFLNITSNSTEVILDLNENLITQTGALSAGSIVSGGTINIANTIQTETLTGDCLDVDSFRIDGNTLVTLGTNENIIFAPQGSGQVILSTDPISDLGIATKRYVDDRFTVVTGGGGGLTGGTSLGTGVGVFAQTNASFLEFRSLKNSDGLVGITQGATEVNLDINEGLITQVGALSGGSIVGGFGSIDVGTSSITGTNLTGTSLVVDNFNIDGNTITLGSLIINPTGNLICSTLNTQSLLIGDIKVDGSTISSNTDLKLQSGGSTILTNGAASLPQGLTTKGYVDTFSGSSSLVTVGALNGGSITTGFGSIDVGTSPITTGGNITGTSLVVDDVTITVGQISSDNCLNLVSSGQVLINGNPTSALGAAPKQYVDAYGGSSSLSRVGALSSGSIVGGFGSIDIGDSNLTTGVLTGGELNVGNINLNGNTISIASGDITLGSTTAVITSNSQLNRLNVDNIRIDANTISSLNTNGNILITTSDELLLKADPITDFGAATRKYCTDRTGGNITLTGALNGGSITSGFGSINVGTSSITGGAISAGAVNVDSLTLNGTTLSGGTINLSGTNILVNSDPTTALGLSTKQYVDNLGAAVQPSTKPVIGSVASANKPIAMNGLCINGGVNRTITSINTGTYTILPTDHTILTTTTSNLTLPNIGTLGGELGREYIILRQAGTTTLTPHGSDSINEGGAGGSVVVSESVIISDGVSNWVLV